MELLICWVAIFAHWKKRFIADFLQYHQDFLIYFWADVIIDLLIKYLPKKIHRTDCLFVIALDDAGLFNLVKLFNEVIICIVESAGEVADRVGEDTFIAQRILSVRIQLYDMGFN